MKRTKVIVFSAVVGLTVGIGAMYAGAFTPSPFKSTAPVTKVTAQVADDRFCTTTATTLQELPNTALTFTQGAGTSGVVIRFSAEWPKPNAAEIPAGSTAAGAFAFLTIDGSRLDLTSDNGGVLMHEGKATSVSNGTHNFEFVTKPLAPGAHTVRVYVLDNILGPPGVFNGTVCVSDRSLVIDHH